MPTMAGGWAGLIAVMALTASAAHAGPPLLLVELPGDVVALPGAEARLRERLAGQIVDAARTRALVDEASALGLQCARLDEQCAAGFGQLAGVDEVIAITAERRGDGVVVVARQIAAKQTLVVDTSIGRLAMAAGDGGVGLEVVALNLLTKRRAPVLVPLTVRVAGPPGGDGEVVLVLVDGAPRRAVDGVVWLSPGAHRIGVPGGEAQPLEVTSRALPPTLTVPAGVDRPVEPVEPVERVEPERPIVVEPVEQATAGGPWGVVAIGGASAALVGGLTMAGAEWWLASEAGSPGRLAAGERILGEGVGVIGVVLVGVGVIGAVGGATLWWSDR
jgi:hypothetical protein